MYQDCNSRHISYQNSIEHYKVNDEKTIIIFKNQNGRVTIIDFDFQVVSTIGKAPGSKGEEIEKAVEEVKEALEPLEKELKSNKFFGGETIGFVDIVGILIAFWFPAIEEALGIELLTTHKFPNLIQWTQELANHTVVKELLPKKDKLVAHLKTVHGKN